MKRVFGLVLFFALLLLMYRFEPLIRVRGELERALVEPFLNKPKDMAALNSLEIQNLRERIRKLQTQNNLLRDQLGAIPERANLFPAEVIRESPSEYFVSFPYDTRVIKGQPAVLGEVYLGRVERVGKRILVIEKPVSSGFVAVGRSEGGSEGRILGQFNEQVVFETNVNSKLVVGEHIYLIESERDWRFLLGKVSEISRDKRLPVKQALIEYLPQRATLTTVFVAE